MNAISIQLIVQTNYKNINLQQRQGFFFYDNARFKTKNNNNDKDRTVESSPPRTPHLTPHAPQPAPLTPRLFCKRKKWLPDQRRNGTNSEQFRPVVSLVRAFRAITSLKTCLEVSWLIRGSETSVYDLWFDEHLSR